MKMEKYSRRSSGFTVTELMVTIGVAGILMGIAVPSLLSWLPTLRLSSASRQVAADLQLARMRAISQNVPFGLNFATNGASSYVVFRDSNNNTVFDAGELDRGPFSLPEGITVSAAMCLVFQARGTASSTGTITLQNGSATQGVVVSVVGRVKVDPAVHGGG